MFSIFLDALNCVHDTQKDTTRTFLSQAAREARYVTDGLRCNVIRIKLSQILTIISSSRNALVNIS